MKNLLGKTFLWGSATAAHQIEGHNSNSDWFLWEKKPGHIKDGSTSEIACQSWEKWREDIKLLKQTNQNAYRFSIEWARIEPTEGQFSLDAVEHYRQILIELKRNNISTMVTLFHFTLPEWVAKKGGFSNKKTIDLFNNFVQKVATEYDSLVDFWIPINEASTYAIRGYLIGDQCPGIKNPFKAILVWLNLIAAQRKIYQTLKNINNKNSVGTNIHVLVFRPARKANPLDICLVYIARNLIHGLYLDLTIRYADFVALNAYYKLWLQAAWPIVKPDPAPKSDYYGMAVHPEAVYESISEIKKWKKPIIITENGIADRNDIIRPKFINEVVKNIIKAISEGARVSGYFYWTLIDNFEWESGYSMKFGLFTRDRQPKKSALVYKNLIKQFRA